VFDVENLHNPIKDNSLMIRIFRAIEFRTVNTMKSEIAIEVKLDHACLIGNLMLMLLSERILQNLNRDTLKIP